MLQGSVVTVKAHSEKEELSRNIKHNHHLKAGVTYLLDGAVFFG